MKRGLFFLLLFLQCGVLFANGSVVCIHGLVSTSKDLAAIRYSLALSGLRIYMWDYPSPKKYFGEHAAALCNVLKDIAACHPGEPIHFVTHSSGALVLRSALNQQCCPEEAKIGRAVLFAPPNQGSKLGRKFRNFLPLRLIIGNKSGLEILTYNACTIAQFFGNFPPTMEVLVIAGTKGNKLFDEPNDGFIALSETYLNTPYYLLAYPIRHGDLLKNSLTLHQMVSFIQCGCCD